MTAPAGPGEARRAPSDAGAAGPGPGSRPILPMAVRRLAGADADHLRILGDYAEALRAIADHPALDAPRKEARLKTVAAVLESGGPAAGEDGAARAALTLRHLLESREIDLRAPRQMLQAAGQDVAKTSYPDWSDLLAWCRYWAAPMGRLGLRLAGGDGKEAEAHGEAFATALALLYLVERAPLQYRWLGRVYLPQRWFRDAGAAPGDLGSGTSTAALRQVFARALDEAGRLLVQCRGLHRGFPMRRTRVAAATAHAEARAWCRALTQGDPLAETCRPGRGARARVAIVGALRGLSP